jgi:hypothetical protein
MTRVLFCCVACRRIAMVRTAERAIRQGIDDPKLPRDRDTMHTTLAWLFEGEKAKRGCYPQISL